MTPQEMTARIKVLEEPLARLPGTMVLLLQSIDNGNERKVAREIWDVLQADLEPPSRL